MLKVKSNQIKEVISIEESNDVLLIDGERSHYDLIKESESKFHLIKENKSYNLEILEVNQEAKEFTIKVNGNEYQLKASDKYDELLSKMGISRGAAKKLNELKAPMPGLVLDIKVEAGQEVKKDEPLLVLEAMKMENVLKSPEDVVIKSVEIKTQDTVEKNQILLKFE